MPSYNKLPYPLKVSRFQHLPSEIQDFLLSDTKREDLINLAKYQGLEGESWIKLNDLVWGVFLRELDIKLLEQGVSEYLRIDALKAKRVGEALRKTVLAKFNDFLNPPAKGKDASLVPQENMVNLKNNK